MPPQLHCSCGAVFPAVCCCFGMHAKKNGKNLSKSVDKEAVSVKDGLVKLLKKESLTHGIQVEISEDNKITLNFHVIVSYGVSISAVTDNLISNVKYKVEEFTGMTVDKINIYIEGVRVID